VLVSYKTTARTIKGQCRCLRYCYRETSLYRAPSPRAFDPAIRREARHRSLTWFPSPASTTHNKIIPAGDDATNRDGAQPRPPAARSHVQDGDRGRRGGGQEGPGVHHGNHRRGAGGKAHERPDPVLPPPAYRGLPRGAEPRRGREGQICEAR